jgi:predicted MFS family arabinose efflux permease
MSDHQRVVIHDGRGPTSFVDRLAGATVGVGTMVPLSAAHGLAAVGDAFVSVSLAGSLFFNVSPDASREQVLLYLLVTMVPLAVLAPLVGPAVDRYRHRQRLVASGFYFTRALCCVALVSTLLQLAFYPIALVLLVVSKASGIVKQTLVQSLVDDPDALVGANARLSRFASITAAVAAAGAVGLLNLTGPEWTLRCGAVLYLAASVVVLTVRPRVCAAAESHDELEYAETHLPVVVVSSIGMIAIRAAVGFFVFTIAFTLRRDSQPAYVYGIAGAAYGVGAFCGHTAASMLRGRWREEQIIAAALAAPAAFTAVGMLGASVPLLVVISALVGLSTTLGRNAFDALVQRVAPDALLGRAGARYETEFQLAWVFGGILATPISLPVEVSMTVLTLMYVPGLLIFVRASRGARIQEEILLDPHGLAVQRLLLAKRALDVGSIRLAVLDAVSAVDLVASTSAPPGPSADGDRAELDELRDRAIDPTGTLETRDAHQAVEIAGRWVNPTPMPRPSGPTGPP